MPVDVTDTLKEALSKLAAEKQRIERQTAAIQEALRAVNGASDGREIWKSKATKSSRRKGRRRMSPAERKAVARRMKAYWAKRRGGMGKRKSTAASNAPGDHSLFTSHPDGHTERTMANR